MSVLGKSQSNKKLPRNSIMLLLACCAVFACQNTGEQLGEAAPKSIAATTAQPEEKAVATPATNDFALPIVKMEAAARVQETPQKEEIVETFQLEVVEQTVVTPAKKAKVEETTVMEVKLVEQTKQTPQQTELVKQEPEKPAPKATSTTTRTATTPRNSTKDRITAPGLLPTPMWIVVAKNTTSEAEAIRLSSQYWSLGYKSNYFWAPDYGKPEQVFKVFIGPFPSQQLAEQFVNEKNDPNLQIVYLQ